MTNPETAALARIRQMADAWEQQLPEVIRTPAVVSALRAVLDSAEPAAVPAAVAPPTDRAAVLRWAADAVAAHPGPIPYRPQLDEDGGFWWDTRDRDAVVALLRRMADETATETPAPTHGEAAFTALMAVPAPALVTVHLPGQPPLVGTWHGGGTGTPRGSADLVWEPTITFPRQPAAGARVCKCPAELCACGHHQPAAGARQDGDES